MLHIMHYAVTQWLREVLAGELPSIRHTRLDRRASAKLNFTPQLVPIYVGLVGVAVVFALTSSATADESITTGPPGGYYQTGQQPYNVDHGHWSDHDSTAAGSFLRGVSSVIQARGVADLHHSQASVIREQAEWLDYQNYKERIDTRYTARRMRRDYLAEKREYRAQQREVGREKLREREATVYRQTYALSRKQFDPSSGQIAWLSQLRYTEFQAAREEVATLFVVRARYQQWEDSALSQELVKAIDQLQETLQANRDAYSSQDYNEAIKFVMGLKYEAKYPTRV